MNEQNVTKMLALLGLARRAGRLAIGFSAVEQLVRQPRKVLIVAASDMGASQKSKVLRFENLAALIDDALTSEQLAEAFGRNKLAIIGLSDSGFVKGIKKLID
jgi:ribosomal protein L7Ae-like RNA K-turn-binding protein